MKTASLPARLDRLRPYPFERLDALLRDARPAPGLEPIRLSIGEPQHEPPGFVLDALWSARAGYGAYPLTRGTAALREACAAWLERRFGAAVDPGRQVLPVNGSREALFAAAQALLEPADGDTVVMPNPFYQIYEGAALLAGAEPVYAPCTPASGLLPDWDAVPADAWDRCRAVYLCSPHNPTGAVFDAAALQRLLERADAHGFLVFADECYSEIYPDEGAPPAGLLGACAAAGRTGFDRCLVFHSLSKRSGLPGLRSGFVAGDARLIEAFLKYRTYHGSAMPPPTQAASIAAWNDEAHVRENRARYRAAFDAVLPVLRAAGLRVARPAGGFYLWLQTPGDGARFARRLYEAQAVVVLPGSFLAREIAGADPGRGYVRVSLVEPAERCAEAARRVAQLIAEDGAHPSEEDGWRT